VWATKDNGFKMREDSRVDYVFAAMVVLLYAQSLVSAFRRGPDDPSWERRWRELDSTEREWIADASYSNSRLAELAGPEKVQLAKGFRRRLNRRDAYRGLAVFPFLVILAALTLGGVVEGTVSFLTFVAAVYAIERPTIRRVKEAKRRSIRVADEPDAARRLSAPAQAE
jgi:hypothetical protein